MPASRLKLLLIAMTLANAMILVDQTAVPLALADIQKSFDVGTQEAQWVLNGSLLPLAGLLVFGGRLGDLLGRRRVFTFGAILFAGASAVGGFAPTFSLLLVARVAQGVGGALMLPATVAIVSAAFPDDQRGRALGTMGGAAAIAAALGPTIGGLLTSAFSWRAVLLINVPLAIVAVLLARRAVAADTTIPAEERDSIDGVGTALLLIALVGLVFGLSTSQDAGWRSPPVVGPLILSALAAAAFVWWERRVASPLVDFALLRKRNYLGASVSQFLGGIVEIGLGVIFPLMLILNLKMTPAEAGIALIPTTVPMIVVAPLAGRWYDRAGGRPPMVAGFVLLAISGLLIAATIGGNHYYEILPGLLVYGIGLALVLTVNDPVTVDTIPGKDQGQAAGVSATAEQFGGAVGIAVLYSIFHAAYVAELHERIDRSSLPDLSDRRYVELRGTIEAAEAHGWSPHQLESSFRSYIIIARAAADHGYSVVFVAVAVIALAGAAAAAWLVRKADPAEAAS